MNWHRAEANKARDVAPKERTKQGQASAIAFTASNREPQGIGRGPVKSIASKSKAAGSLGTEATMQTEQGIQCALILSQIGMGFGSVQTGKRCRFINRRQVALRCRLTLSRQSLGRLELSQASLGADMPKTHRMSGSWQLVASLPLPPSFSSALPRKIVTGWLSHGDTEVANRATLWDSVQSLVSPNTNLTYRDAFRSWQASGCKTLAMATWDSQGLKKTELGLSDRLGAWEAGSSRLLEEHSLGPARLFATF